MERESNLELINVEGENEYYLSSSNSFLADYYCNIDFSTSNIVKQEICSIQHTTEFFGYRYYQSHIRIIEGKVLLYCVQHSLLNLGSLNEKYKYHNRRLNNQSYICIDAYCHYYLKPLQPTIYTCCVIDPRNPEEIYDSSYLLPSELIILQ